MSEFEWRRKLAQLPRERSPEQDLWPGIQARISPTPGRRWPPRSRWLTGLALAASLGVVTVLALRFAPAGMPSPSPESEHLLLRQAESLALEYRGALSALGPIEFPIELAGAVHDIDDSLAQLHQALQEAPEADFLLDRLRKTYAQRLRLSQRIVTDWT